MTSLLLHKNIQICLVFLIKCFLCFIMGVYVLHNMTLYYVKMTTAYVYQLEITILRQKGRFCFNDLMEWSSESIWSPPLPVSAESSVSGWAIGPTVAFCEGLRPLAVLVAHGGALVQAARMSQECQQSQPWRLTSSSRNQNKVEVSSIRHRHMSI